MKKILTFAIVALLMGGFAVNANAQDRKAKNQDKKEVVGKKKIKTVETKKATEATEESKADNALKSGKEAQKDYGKLITEFEQAVDNCLAAYKAMQSNENASKSTEKFDKLLANAEELKAEIGKVKSSLDKNLTNRYQKACTKLAQIYKK